MEILIYVNTDMPLKKKPWLERLRSHSLPQGRRRKGAKSKLAMEGRSLSDAVEEFLLIYNELDFLDKFCESLGLESRFYNTSPEITSNRSTGLKAEDLIFQLSLRSRGTD